MDRAIFLCLLLVAALKGIESVSVEEDLTLTLSQKQALDKFREQVKPLLKNDFMKTDIYLIRWLRARNFNVNDAEIMLKENLQWRERNKMDTIRSEDFSDMFRDFPVTVDSYDKAGRPVAAIDMFDWDVRDAVIAGRAQRLLRYLDMLGENVTMQVYERQQRGMNVTQWTVISNGDNFNMINHGCPICLPFWIRFLASLENHFPGWMNEFIVVDATRAAWTMFDMMRPLLSRQTRDAVKVFDLNRSLWMPYLDARIARDQRRAPYGGTKPSKPVRH